MFSVPVFYAEYPVKEKFLYRYHEAQVDEMWSRQPQIASQAMRLYLNAYLILKETPCGCWIEWGYGEKKFVNLKARKKFAHLTPEEAMEAFKARKRRQIAILNGQLLRAEAALHLSAEKAIPLRKGMFELGFRVA